jgi:hypothetical protein
MDQALLRAYLASVYELPSPQGPVRASLDGDATTDPSQLPELLRSDFAVVTAFNPRSMALPRKVNEGRHIVMRDLLIIGCYRVEPCVGFEEGAETSWREPSWLVHHMNRDEAIAFGRVFRQNMVLVNRNARPELIVTDYTFDDIGTTVVGNWRVRA